MELPLELLPERRIFPVGADGAPTVIMGEDIRCKPVSGRVHEVIHEEEWYRVGESFLRLLR